MIWLYKAVIHEIGHNLGLNHAANGTGDIMSYDDDKVGYFNGIEIEWIFNMVKNGYLNKGSNSEKSEKEDHNWFWHTTTNDEPYIKNVNVGDIIPKIIHNP